MQCHEQLSMRGPRSSLLQITQDRISDHRKQRIALNAALLGTQHANRLSCPIKVLEPELSDLAPTEAIERQQQQDCMITNVHRAVAACALKQSSHVFPEWAFRDAFALIEAGSLDAGGQACLLAAASFS